MGTTTRRKPPDAAVGLTMFRVLPNGEARTYLNAWASWEDIEHSVRTARAVGYLNDDDADGVYAVLDVLDEDEDVLDDYVIPTARAARWWYRHLGLRVQDNG